MGDSRQSLFVPLMSQIPSEKRLVLTSFWKADDVLSLKNAIFACVKQI